MGVAFANDSKAYVAPSTSNLIVVSGTRLCMIPFESNNQSQLSGCRAERTDKRHLYL